MAKQKLIDDVVASLPSKMQQAVRDYFAALQEEKALRVERKAFIAKQRAVYMKIEAARERFDPDRHPPTPLEVGTLLVNLRNGRVYEVLKTDERSCWRPEAHIQADTGRWLRSSYSSWGPKLPLPPEHPLYTKRANAKLAERLEGKDNK